ncbi:MAG: phosphoribosylamine--glycine ligase [Actinobacteria bacterium]|nr:MAG: phosphoribosylamine--glycine ligase [Actinomycetota bacterium]
MRVLLLGGGGREHALGWKLAQSDRLTELVSAPGNPGLEALGSCLPGLDITDPAAVVEAARPADLVVIGPEAPLAAGVVDALQEAGIPAFGPTAAGARLEASKRYAKEVMVRSGVPTAPAAAFTDGAEAASHLADMTPPYVVKADGLAAGKGVLVTDDLIAAQAWAGLCIDGHFGEAGRTVVVEEHLAGREVSVFALCDGERAVALQPARDYKRLGDGDTGPNTGGMGCYSPVSDLPPGLVEHTLRTVIVPVLETLAGDGITYRGFLYAGLMLDDGDINVLEFNCRMGDPESQVVLPRLDEDLLELLSSPIPDRQLRWHPTAAVDVVLASAGYPERSGAGVAINGLDGLGGRSDVLAFHAGTARAEDGTLTVAGGRVVNVVGLGDTVAEAREAAYDAVAAVDFEGMQYRKDIAGR